MTAPASPGFVPPAYPYDLLKPIIAIADRLDGGCVDLSVGTPVDPPPPAVVAALANSRSEPGYPPSIGSAALREAFAAWAESELGVQLDPATQVAATIGSKEFVAGLPHWLRLRTPDKDTVLYPAISYPSYAMGATFANARAVPVPVDENWSPQLDQISPQDAERALVLWMNTPGNPAGGLDDLDAAAKWGADNNVPVFSDECYAEYTWAGSARSILAGADQDSADQDSADQDSAGQNGAGQNVPGHAGVVAVHSLSKRSNLAGVRVGFYAGDAELVDYLKEVRKHAGFMVPGPTQAAAVAALADQQHVEIQRERYHSRLQRLAKLLERLGVAAQMPQGGFYLWVPAPTGGTGAAVPGDASEAASGDASGAAVPTGDAWEFVRHLADKLGLVVAPGEFFGPAGSGYVRIAAVATDQQMELLEQRSNNLGHAPAKSTAAK